MSSLMFRSLVPGGPRKNVPSAVLTKEEQVEVASGERADVLAAFAEENPHILPEIQAQLAVSVESSTRRSLACNPHLGKDPSLRLATDSDPGVRKNLARSTSDPDVLDVLAQKDERDVLLLVVKSEAATLDTYVTVSFTKDLLVARHVAMQLTARGLEPDTRFSARFFTLEGYVSPDLLRMLPAADEESVTSLAKDWDGTVAELGEAVMLVSR